MSGSSGIQHKRMKRSLKVILPTKWPHPWAKWTSRHGSCCLTKCLLEPCCATSAHSLSWVCCELMNQQIWSALKVFSTTKSIYAKGGFTPSTSSKPLRLTNPAEDWGVARKLGHQ